MKIKFGGPNLPKGTTTFYNHLGEDGRERCVHVAPGDVVDVSLFALDTKDGFVNDPTAADYYVKSGRASYVEDDGQTPADPPAPVHEE